MRRAVCIIILVTMTLHCASRLGFVSYVFENRHEIAYRIGLITEIPIAMCTGDFFEKNGPVIIHEADTDDTRQVPGQIATAKELNLFSERIINVFASPHSACTDLHNTLCVEPIYDQPSLTIFHPPC